MPQIAKFYHASSGTWSVNSVNGAFILGSTGEEIIRTAVNGVSNPGATVTLNVWYTFGFDVYYKLVAGLGDTTFLVTETIRMFDLPFFDVATISPGFDNMASPNLTFDYDVMGKPISYVLGTLALAGSTFWAKGVNASGSIIVDTTLSFAVGLGIPIDPTEVVTLGRIWANDKLIYTPSTGPLLDLFTPPTLYQGTATQAADPLILADKGAADTPAFRDLRYAVFDQFPITAVQSANPRMVIEMIAPDRIRLDDAIVLIYAKCGIDVVVEGVEDMISAAVFTNGIQPQEFSRLLHDVYRIDVLDESPLRLVKRAVGPSLVIDHVRNLSNPDDRISKTFKFTRVDDVVLPNEIDLHYIDAARNYEENYQFFKFPKYPQEYTPSTVVKSVSLPFSITATEDIQLAAEMLHTENTAAVGAVWDDDDLEIAEGDTVAVEVSAGTFVFKVEELQLARNDVVGITASQLQARTGNDLTADSGDLLDSNPAIPYRLWEILRPQEIIIVDGILYDPVFTVEDTQAGLLHVLFTDTMQDNINSRQIVLGDASVFGDGTIAGYDGAYTYVINHDHIIRIQRTFPYAHQELELTFSGGAGLRTPALVQDGLLRVVASGSGGATLYTLDLNNFDETGLSTIDLDDDPIGVHWIAENASYVAIGASVPPDVQETIYRITKADDTVVSDNVSQGMGSGVSDGSIVYAQPRSTLTPNSIGTTYEFATRSLGTFDVDDDLSGARGFRYFSGIVIDGTTLAYLVNEITDVLPYVGEVTLATRNTSGLTPIGIFTLSDVDGYDINTYYPSMILKIPGFYVVTGLRFRAEGSPFGVDETFIMKIADDLSGGILLPTPAPPPPDDNFADRTPASSSIANIGTTAGATAEVGEPDNNGDPPVKSIWRVFTIPGGGTGTWRFDFSQTLFPSRVTLSTGTVLGSLTPVAADTSVNAFTAVGPVIDVALTAGDVINITLDGMLDSSDRAFGGAYSFTITPP